jgi:hypothetical protein
MGVIKHVSKEKAKSILKKFEGIEYIDRYNLEILLNRYTKKDIVYIVDPEKEKRVGLKVGWGFNYCSVDPILDRNVTENILEIPLLKELISRNCKIAYIGGSPNKFKSFHSDIFDFSSEWKKLPKPYTPTSDWIADCVHNYENKYKMKLPDVDFVIMNAFPSFFNSNMRFYLTCLHYAKKKIPVFLWDPELRTVCTNENKRFSRYFKYSGADKVFTKDQFRMIAKNSYWLLQIPLKASDKIKEWNPKLQILSFFPPYDLSMGVKKFNDNPLYRISYVGNDSERRMSFKEFFTPLSDNNKLHLFGGGMSKRQKGYEGFEKYMGNTKHYGAIEQNKVWDIYNNTRVCLSIARNRYYQTGWIVHRWFEAVLSGCILLLPSKLYGVEKYMNKNFIVESHKDLEDKIDLFNDRLKLEKVKEANLYQKKKIYRMFSSEKNIDRIIKAVNERKNKGMQSKSKRIG